MIENQEEIIAFIDELIARGERLGQIKHRAHENSPDSSVFIIGTYPVYPASQEEYSRWDTDCRILMTMLGDAAKAFEGEFAGSTYDEAQAYIALAPQKVGNLRAIKDAVVKGRIRTHGHSSRSSAMRRDREGSRSTVNVGNLYGGIQIESPNASQNVTLNTSQKLYSMLDDLHEVVDSSDLDEVDKDEIEHNLERIKRLADGQPSAKVKTSILEKLAAVEKVVSISDALMKVAAPLIIAARAHYG